MEPKENKEKQSHQVEQKAEHTLEAEIMYLSRDFSHKEIYTYYLYKKMAEYQQVYSSFGDEHTREKFFKKFIHEFRKNSYWEKEELDAIEKEFIDSIEFGNKHKYKSQLTSTPEEGGLPTVFHKITAALEEFVQKDQPKKSA